MTTAQTAAAYQQFAAALAAWWATPGRHAFRKPELADFDGTDPFEESPQSERAETKKPDTAEPKKPDTKNQKPKTK